MARSPRYKSETDTIGPLSISDISWSPELKKKTEGENRSNTKRRNMEFVGLLDGHIQRQLYLSTSERCSH